MSKLKFPKNGHEVNNLIFANASPIFMPNGRTRAPTLLTSEEAIKFLRLDIDGPKDAEATLKHYRDEGLLNPTQVGKRIRYLLKELLRFLDELTYGKAA